MYTHHSITRQLTSIITRGYCKSFDLYYLYKTCNQRRSCRDEVSYQRIVNLLWRLNVFYLLSACETWDFLPATMGSSQAPRQGGLGYRNGLTKSVFFRSAPSKRANLTEEHLHRISPHHRYCDYRSAGCQTSQQSASRDRRWISHTGNMLLGRCVGLCLADERSNISPDGNGAGHDRD